MYVVFFNYTGVLASTKLIPTVGRKTVNAAFYVKKCLKKLVKMLKENRPKSGTQGIFLHHDNASAHTAMLTTCLEGKKLRIFSHPTCSPDLLPCDFFGSQSWRDFSVEKLFSHLSSWTLRSEMSSVTVPITIFWALWSIGSFDVKDVSNERVIISKENETNCD